MQDSTRNDRDCGGKVRLRVPPPMRERKPDLAAVRVPPQIREPKPHLAPVWVPLLALVLALSLSVSAPAKPPVENSGPTFVELLAELADLSTGPKGAAVSGFVFEREQGVFSLDDGALFPCTEVGGRTAFFLFEGQGRFLYPPPLQIERDHHRRLRLTEVAEEEFAHALFYFGDQSSTQLARAFEYVPREPGKKAVKFLEKARDYFPEPGVLNSLLCHDFNDMFYAHLDASEDLCFRVNPYEAEEVTLSQDRTKFRSVWSPVTQHHRAADYTLGLQEDYDSVDRTRVGHYALTTRISNGLDIEVEARLDLEGEPRPWLRFRLHPDLEIEEATWGDGTRLEFGREEDSWNVWVATPEEWTEKNELRLVYNGDYIERDGDWIQLKSSIGWYPRAGSRRAATFDLRYEVPEKFTFVSVGERIEETIEDRIRKVRYRIGTPVRNATFDVGHLETYEIRDDRIPPLKVLYSKNHHREIAQTLIEEGVPSGKDMHKQVAADVANALAFFQSVYGKGEPTLLTAVETPTGHGEAFPGLINLAWSTFQISGRERKQELFRAHEVAHQWWGASGVDFSSYHDQWLSEAFAEYSALWFVQAGLGDSDAFFSTLKDWRDQIFDNRNYLVGEGTEAGPVWLGYRTDTNETRGDYNLIVYRKGAWALHMIRNLLMDLNTLDDSSFQTLVHDFYQEHQGQRAATTDFLLACEKAAGVPMDWFFDQWILGTDLPHFRYAWTSRENEDGEHVISMRVSQNEVAPEFRSYVPLRVDLENGQLARMRVHITGAESEFDLPAMPTQPKDLLFNEFESVLCRHEEIDWE